MVNKNPPLNITKIIFLIILILLPIHIVLSQNNSTNFLTHSFTNKNKIDITKIAIIGRTHSDNLLLQHYYEHTNLNNQLGGSKPMFYSLWINMFSLNPNKPQDNNILQFLYTNFINSITPDYIIVYNINLNNYPKFKMFLDQQYKDKYFTIGYSKSKYNLTLNLDISNLLNFLNDIQYSIDNAYFLQLPTLSVFDEFINKHDFNKIELLNITDLRKLLIDIKQNENILIFDSLLYLYSDISGKIVTKKEIRNEYIQYRLKSPIVTIQHNYEFERPLFFEYSWNIDKITAVLDTFIVSSFYDILTPDEQSQVLNAELNINLENIYNVGLLDNRGLSKLSNYVKYFDGVK